MAITCLACTTQNTDVITGRWLLVQDRAGSRGVSPHQSCTQGSAGHPPSGGTSRTDALGGSGEGAQGPASRAGRGGQAGGSSSTRGCGGCPAHPAGSSGTPPRQPLEAAAGISAAPGTCPDGRSAPGTRVPAARERDCSPGGPAPAPTALTCLAARAGGGSAGPGGARSRCRFQGGPRSSPPALPAPLPPLL